MYFDAKFLDGAAVVHLLPVTNITTFDDYAHQVFIPHVIKQLENTTRVDVVWGTYIPNSIKESTRERRGTGIRRKVAGKNTIPGNWSDFLLSRQTNKNCFLIYQPKSRILLSLMTKKLFAHLARQSFKKETALPCQYVTTRRPTRG